MASVLMKSGSRITDRVTLRTLNMSSLQACEMSRQNVYAFLMR